MPLVDLEDTAVDSKSLTKVPHDNYPTPSVLQEPFGKGQGASGYIYENESVAVISIPSFDVDAAQNQSASFAKAVSDTLYEAQKAGVRKIVVDVSGNGGGVAFQAYETFRRIFPDIYPYQLIRAQATDALNIVGSSYDTVIANKGNIVNQEQQSSAKKAVAGRVPITSTSKFTARNNTSTNFTAFSSWFGPLSTSNNGKYTNPARFDFTNPDLAEGMGLNSQVFGFGNNTVPKDYPRYSPSDVILLTDGFCGSTYAVFAELMVSAADVLAVTMGGTPTYGPIQYAGGTRGGNVWPWAEFDQVFTQLRESAAADPQLAAKVGLNQSALEALPPPLSEMKYADKERNRVNALDQVRADDPSNTPLGFQYEPADCRLFYTREMILDQSEVWMAAAKVGGGNFGACVKGSTGQKVLITESPGFNNNFQAAVKGVWSANATWGSLNVGNGSQIGGPGNATSVGGQGTVPFQGDGTMIKSNWLTVLGAVVAGFFVIC